MPLFTRVTMSFLVSLSSICEICNFSLITCIVLFQALILTWTMSIISSLVDQYLLSFHFNLLTVVFTIMVYPKLICAYSTFLLQVVSSSFSMCYTDMIKTNKSHAWDIQVSNLLFSICSMLLLIIVYTVFHFW